MTTRPLSPEREAEIREDVVSMCDADVVRELLAEIERLRIERDHNVAAIAHVRETCTHLWTDRSEENDPYRVGQDKMADVILEQLDEHYRKLLVATGSWVPCSPEWLAAHPNQCATAARAPGYDGISHLHPALPEGDAE
jgi:hypothetical protein